MITKEECKVKMKHSIKNVVRISAKQNGFDLAESLDLMPETLGDVDKTVVDLMIGYFLAQFDVEQFDGDIEKVMDDEEFHQYYLEAVEEIKQEYGDA